MLNKHSSSKDRILIANFILIKKRGGPLSIEQTYPSNNALGNHLGKIMPKLRDQQRNIA